MHKYIYIDTDTENASNLRTCQPRSWLVTIGKIKRWN